MITSDLSNVTLCVYLPYLPLMPQGVDHMLRSVKVHSVPLLAIDAARR